MNRFPFPAQQEENPLGAGHAEVALLRHDLYGRAHGGAFLVACLGGRDFLFEAVDVVDDGDVFGAVAFYGAAGV